LKAFMVSVFPVFGGIRLSVISAKCGERPLPS
jgi:hypothetical protein